MERIVDNYTVALILAGGSGTRMGCDKTKQKIEILGETVLRRSVRAFCEAKLIDGIIVVSRADEIDEVREMIADLPKVISVVVGGDCRRESARLGFEAVPEDTSYVAIHDAARCLITPEEIDLVVSEAKKYGAATCSSPIFDTVKREKDGFIVGTVDRSELRIAQTPQVFSAKIYKKAIEKCEKNVNITDDNMMVEELGIAIKCVNTSSQNIKITTADDLALAEFILEKRRENV